MINLGCLWCSDTHGRTDRPTDGQTDGRTYNQMIEQLCLFEAVVTKMRHTDRHVPTALEKSPLSAEKWQKSAQIVLEAVKKRLKFRNGAYNFQLFPSRCSQFHK